MQQTLKLFISIMAISVLFIACDSKKPAIPDFEKKDLGWQWIPFHLEQVPTGDITNFTDEKLERYPSFSPLFFSSVVPISQLSPPEQKELLNDPGLLHLVDTCKQIFHDHEDIRNEFEHAFQLYTHYTGDHQVPNIYTFISGFAYQTFIFSDGDRDGMGIGLDMFLGSDFPYRSIDFSNASFSAYLSYFFDKKYLVRKALLTWLDDKIPPAAEGNLLDIAIRNGKIYFFLEKLLPRASKDIILEMKDTQYQWCLANEEGIWAYLLQNDLLYETQFLRINKLVNPSPGAPGFPPEAPGGVANYIGWRIVQNYMMRSDASWHALMHFGDAQQILEVAKYKPISR